MDTAGYRVAEFVIIAYSLLVGGRECRLINEVRETFDLQPINHSIARDRRETRTAHCEASSSLWAVVGELAPTCRNIHGKMRMNKRNIANSFMVVYRAGETSRRKAPKNFKPAV